jgi:hypothetical protein
MLKVFWRVGIILKRNTCAIQAQVKDVMLDSLDGLV